MNEHKIKIFLRANPRYVNPLNVLIISGEHHVGVTSIFDLSENPKQHFMGISCFCNSHRLFSGLFKIYDVRDISRITPEYLKRLFRLGRADLYCYPGENHLLPVHYRKTEGGMTVRFANGTTHQVTENLVTNEDFFNHAGKFLRMLQDL